MRRWPLLGVLLGALGLLGWLALREPAALVRTESRERLQPRERGPGGSLLGLSLPGPSPTGAASRSIRGRVTGPRGPVAGVELRASREVPGESLSARPCDDRHGDAPDRPSVLCQKSKRIDEWVAQREGEASVLARSTSAGDGSFVLEGLEAGTYALWAESPDGATVLQDVEAGGQDVELRLGAGVRLSGTITGEGGVVLPGALVTAIFAIHSRFFEAVADDAGHYSLGPLPMGAYVLRVSKDGWLPLQQRWARATPVQERPFVLESPRTVSVRVTRGGAPVRGARVRLTSIPEQEPAREGLSDAEGHFSFDGLSPHYKYLLMTRHEGLGARVEMNFAERQDSGAAALVAHRDVALELEPMTDVRGRVLDEFHKPIAHALVSLDTPVEEDSTVLTWTDEEGHYALGPVKPGLLLLGVHAEEGRVLAGQTWTSFPAGTSTKDLILTPAPPTQRQGVDADGQREVDGRSPTVEGEVVDETGAPVPGVEVGLWPDGARPIEPQLYIATTDARGHFLLEAPSEGRYQLSAELQDQGLEQTVTQGVELGKGQTHVRLRFEPAQPISGQVVDEQGRPLENAFVDLRAPLHPIPTRCEAGGLSTSVSTNAEGRFRIQSVSGSSLYLLASREGYTMRRPVKGEAFEPPRVDAGAKDVRVVLMREAKVHGQLVRADGSPITQFSLNQTVRQSASGEFSWPITGTETLQLEFILELHPGESTMRRSVPVEEGKDLDLGKVVFKLP